MDSDGMMLDSSVNPTDQNIIYVDSTPTHYNVEDDHQQVKNLIGYYFFTFSQGVRESWYYF